MFLLSPFTGAACRVCEEEMSYDSAHVLRLSKRLVEGITSQLEYVVFNGDPDHTYPGCVNLSFAYVEGESLLMALKVKFGQMVLLEIIFVTYFKSVYCLTTLTIKMSV